jgi:hypothetical protein
MPGKGHNILSVRPCDAGAEIRQQANRKRAEQSRQDRIEWRTPPEHNGKRKDERPATDQHQGNTDPFMARR